MTRDEIVAPYLLLMWGYHQQNGSVAVPILSEETCLYPDSLLDNPNDLGPFDGCLTESWTGDSSSQESWRDYPSGKEIERQWRLVYTKSRQEKALARHLLCHQVPFYLPLVPKDNLIRGRRVRSHMPLFGGYMFLFADETERETCLASNRVSQIHPVHDSEKLRIDLQQIFRLIQSDMAVTLEQRLTPGQRVRVRSGPFKGTSGVLVSRRGNTKLLVAVDFIGQGVSIEIDDFQLEAL